MHVESVSESIEAELVSLGLTIDRLSRRTIQVRRRSMGGHLSMYCCTIHFDLQHTFIVHFAFGSAVQTAHIDIRDPDSVNRLFELVMDSYHSTQRPTGE